MFGQFHCTSVCSYCIERKAMSVILMSASIMCSLWLKQFMKVTIKQDIWSLLDIFTWTRCLHTESTSTSASVWWKHMLKVFQPTSHLVSVPRRCRYRRYNLHFFKTSHFVATLCESSWLNLRCIYDNLIFYKSEYIKWTQPMFDKHATNFQRYIFLRNVDVLFKSYLAARIRFLW